MQIFESVEKQVNLGLVFIHYILFVIVQVHEHKPELLESTSLYRSTVQNLKKQMEIWAMKSRRTMTLGLVWATEYSRIAWASIKILLVTQNNKKW